MSGSSNFRAPWIHSPLMGRSSKRFLRARGGFDRVRLDDRRNDDQHERQGWSSLGKLGGEMRTMHDFREQQVNELHE